MNLHLTMWRFFIILLSLSIRRGPLLPAACLRFKSCAVLTVEPAPLFLLGSNLTVYCHTRNCPQRDCSKISLELDRKSVDPWERVNCTLMSFTLFHVQEPLSTLRCKLHRGQRPQIVGGLDLHGGLPPNEPKNIFCETTRSSHFIDCSWEKGEETHVPTAYNISVHRENGTQILSNQIWDAEEVTIPRAMMDENTKHQLIITAHNHFGTSQSDPVNFCVKDILIPETPRITMKSWTDSQAVLLEWKSAETSERLRSYVRLSTDSSFWEEREGTELSEGLIQVDNLRPLTDFEFQMRTCYSGQTHADTARTATGSRSLCSKWSPSVWGRSPGKSPSQQLHVWGMLGSQATNGSQIVTVLWKPLPPEDYSGEVQQYKIFFGNDQTQDVSAALSQCSLRVPAEVQTLSVSAVTLYGSSPAANLPLRHSGDFGPVLRDLAPAHNGSAVSVSWWRPGNKHGSATGGEMLHYVLEWRSVPAAELQWEKLTTDQNNTFITGLTAGVRYNISLYAVTAGGVSAPSSGLVYAKEQKPVSGPNMSVLVHEARWILIKWDELPVNRQRGFVTNYTIYVQQLDSNNTEVSVMVSSSDPRQKWLNCPEGALALQMTASTSAGEGPRGIRISSQPATPAVGLVLVIVSILALFTAIIANLMYWNCVRERIKQKCVSWGPAWFGENLPKPGNSVAIRLLEQEGNELNFSSTYSDPPLSPISLISQDERDDVYPNIHVDMLHDASRRLTVETAETMLRDSQLEDVSYKPQIAPLVLLEEEMVETEEEQGDVPTCGEEHRCSGGFGGLLGGFLSSVEVEFSGSHLGPALSSVNSLLWPKTPETMSVLNGGFILGSTENTVEADLPSLDLQQAEVMTCDTADIHLSQHTVETARTGYFPQVAAVSTTTLCDTQK